jgi:hypothetical protein
VFTDVLKKTARQETFFEHIVLPPWMQSRSYSKMPRKMPLSTRPVKVIG